jgi:CubicO group peptidase (beta-lactamase class C family)
MTFLSGRLLMPHWPALALIALSIADVRAQNSKVDLDAIASRVIAQEHVVGASVLVAEDNRIIFEKGYGFADLGLEAPTKTETVYRVVGPMMPLTGIAILQLADRGKLSLDDDISKFVPEFPLQGNHVSIRQLLNHTSGIVDYHYLGDPIEATSRQPKALDEVMALYADKRWVHKPGTKWDWSISGFQLLVTILERVTGQTYESYVQENIFGPAGVASTTYCDDFSLVHGLSHGYRRFGKGHVLAHEDAMAYNTDLRYCSTVGDLFQTWRAVEEKKLVRPETLKSMRTPEGAAIDMRAEDPQMHFGLALTLNHEDGHRSVGQHGSLLGYSGSLYEFPEDRLTIVVLTNTEGQNAYALTRALARAILGLPDLPKPTESRPAAPATDQPVSPLEIRRLTGTFVLTAGVIPSNLHDSYAQYRRTYRVFNENGRLMIQALGQGAERLLKQEDGSFRMLSAERTRISFALETGHATGMHLDPPGGLPLAGSRVGDADPQTFHQQMR